MRPYVESDDASALVAGDGASATSRSFFFWGNDAPAVPSRAIHVVKRRAQHFEIVRVAVPGSKSRPVASCWMETLPSGLTLPAPVHSPPSCRMPAAAMTPCGAG
jgi:hypothetical protein